MSKAIIVDCTCQHRLQDELHGKGKRVANQVHGKDTTGLPSGAGAFRCTVCLKIHKVSIKQ